MTAGTAASTSAAPELAPARLVHRFLEIEISPDAAFVASVEGDSPPNGFYPPIRDLVVRGVRDGIATRIVLPCGQVPQCWPAAPAWAPDGISNWQSYYGENGIDAWMLPYFGASVYQDPAVYAQSSAINFIRNVKTPTFEYVGERDIECPAPQTQEFWHALKDLNVPTSIMIYPGEGHGLRDPAHSADAMRRTLDWFDKYLK